MYYELYVDSLFLVNFVMNLYLLLLVDAKLFRTATRKHLLLGAAVGAILFFLPFFIPGPLWLRYVVGMPPGGILMLIITFRIKNVKSFWRYFECYLMYSFLLGGVMLVMKRVPWIEPFMNCIWGILGVGAMLYLLIGYRKSVLQGKRSLCRVTLVHNGNRVTVTALLDSGNSLTEPVSGKPVAVIEADLVRKLWGEEPGLYRAVPYHSIGKKKGILKGFWVQELRIEAEDVVKICEGAYVAVCEEYITDHVKMILNPIMLCGEEKRKEERFG